MEEINNFIKIRVFWIVFGSMALIAAFSGLASYFYSPPGVDGKPDMSAFLFSLFSGAFSGFVVLIFQVLYEYRRLSEISRLNSLNIINVLSSRSDTEYYGDLIKGARREVVVMGVTARRLLTDFATESSPNERNKLLISALKRDVNVRLLVADRDFLEASEHYKFDGARDQLKKLSTDYQNFSCRYYQHAPTHNVFGVDGDLLVGPVFPNVMSMNCPSIHANASSPLCKSYKGYFEAEWAVANPI